MCGIAGILTPDRAAAGRAIEAMNSAQRHRGPDDEGEAYYDVGDRWLGLGHRRLAILDLTPMGHQPMVDAETGDCLVYNGEIYSLAGNTVRRDLAQGGVRLRGRSDTEVLLRILQRDGLDALARLDGMFAFAFFNVRERTLTLARDAAGIKPLYIARAGETLIFASEARAILATGLIPRRIDQRGAAGYLAYGSVQEPLTLFEGIRSLEPGTALTIDLRQPDHESVRRFWRPPSLRTGGGVDLPAEIRSTMEAEVRAHLASDVPVGVFLSSGLDSTVIAALAARGEGRVSSFTVSVEPFDEAPMARRTADLLGIRHRAIGVKEEEALEASRLWLDRMDQPSIDGLNTFIISRAVRQAGFSVALSGVGGDELFGGYPSFRDVPRLKRQLTLARWMPRPARRVAARIAARGRHSVARQKARDLAGTDASVSSVYLHRRRLMSNDQMRRLGFRAVDGLTEDFLPSDSVPPMREDDPVASVALLEFSTYMRSTLLRDSDIASMASSLELRVPMLSRPVLDLMLAVPGPELVPEGVPPKYLERIAFADFLRSELTDQPKHGFVLPMARWMLGPLRQDCLGSLEVLRGSGAVGPDGIDIVWRSFEREPESPAWSRAWSLVALGRFLQRL
jgi:asparagine synthase (glutamine-hydrolysing)